MNLLHAPTTGQCGVLRTKAEYRLIASETIAAGALLFHLEGEETYTPTRYSVQIGPSTHIDIGSDHTLQEILDRYYWRFMNHHCEPNTVIRERNVFTLREIQPWEEITFNYNTTEYAMAEPFSCRCGSERCQGLIRGFIGLSVEEQHRLRPWFASYLQDRVVAEVPVSALYTTPYAIHGNMEL